jgi:hypothetical protein
MRWFVRTMRWFVRMVVCPLASSTKTKIAIGYLLDSCFRQDGDTIAPGNRTIRYLEQSEC